MVLKKLTYGLDRHTITLRRVTLDGELNSGDKEQYSVSVKKDLTPALSSLECALIQVNYSATRKAAESDQNRELMVKRVGTGSADNSIYIPTLCIIGSIMHLSSKHKIFDLKEISQAVAKKNELWVRAVKDFNGLFSSEGIRCLKKAVRHPQGKRILNRFLSGLRFVTDLLYESYSLKKDGLFEESFEIDEIVSDIGIMQTDAYMLLLSPMHPEYQTLVRFIGDYSSCHELYLSDADRWVMVNKRAVKHINVENLERYLQLLDEGGVNKSALSAASEVAPQHRIDAEHVVISRNDVEQDNLQEESGLSEPEGVAVDITELAPGDDVDDFIERGGFDGIDEPEMEEPDFDEEGYDSELHQEEPQEPQSDEGEEEEGDDGSNHNEEGMVYSARRRRPKIKKPNVAQVESNQSLFSRPSNAARVNFDVSDI